MADIPEVGKQYTFKGQTFTVTALKKRGKPPKDGSFGGQVIATDPGGDEITVKFRDWQKGAQP